MKNILLFFCILAFTANTAWATTQPPVRINEIAWMGTTASATDEWIELFNTGQEAISLKGWVLKSADEKIVIYLRGYIEGQNYYLLERTDDHAVPSVKANVIYKGALNNNGGSLLLYDANRTMVDQAAFTAKWPAGNSSTRQTMERTDALGWQTSTSPGGTPGAANSLAVTVAQQDNTLPSSQKIDNSNSVQAQVASVKDAFSAPLEKEGASNPWVLFIVAIVIASLLATVAVVIKVKLAKEQKV